MRTLVSGDGGTLTAFLRWGGPRESKGGRQEGPGRAQQERGTCPHPRETRAPRPPLLGSQVGGIVPGLPEMVRNPEAREPVVNSFPDEVGQLTPHGSPPGRTEKGPPSEGSRPLPQIPPPCSPEGGHTGRAQRREAETLRGLDARLAPGQPARLGGGKGGTRRGGGQLAPGQGARLGGDGWEGRTPSSPAPWRRASTSPPSALLVSSRPGSARGHCSLLVFNQRGFVWETVSGSLQTPLPALPHRLPSATSRQLGWQSARTGCPAWNPASPWWPGRAVRRCALGLATSRRGCGPPAPPPASSPEQRPRPRGPTGPGGSAPQGLEMPWEELPNSGETGGVGKEEKP